MKKYIALATLVTALTACDSESSKTPSQISGELQEALKSVCNNVEDDTLGLYERRKERGNKKEGDVAKLITCKFPYIVDGWKEYISISFYIHSSRKFFEEQDKFYDDKDKKNLYKGKGFIIEENDGYIKVSGRAKSLNLFWLTFIKKDKSEKGGYSKLLLDKLNQIDEIVSKL